MSFTEEIFLAVTAAVELIVTISKTEGCVKKETRKNTRTKEVRISEPINLVPSNLLKKQNKILASAKGLWNNQCNKVDGAKYSIIATHIYGNLIFFSIE